jgi:hypothetical protein
LRQKTSAHRRLAAEWRGQRFTDENPLPRHGETFERALKLSADYAAFTGGDMVEATHLIGKALADELSKAYADADIKQKQAAAEILEAWKQQENQRLGVLDDQHKQARLAQIIDGLRTEREIETQSYTAQQQLLQGKYNGDYKNRAFGYQKIWQLDRQHQATLGKIEDPALAARQAMVKQAMAGDLVSMGQFFGEAEGLISKARISVFGTKENPNEEIASELVLLGEGLNMMAFGLSEIVRTLSLVGATSGGIWQTNEAAALLQAGLTPA